MRVAFSTTEGRLAHWVLGPWLGQAIGISKSRMEPRIVEGDPIHGPENSGFKQAFESVRRFSWTAATWGAMPCGKGATAAVVPLERSHRPPLPVFCGNVHALGCLIGKPKKYCGQSDDRFGSQVFSEVKVETGLLHRRVHDMVVSGRGP